MHVRVVVRDDTISASRVAADTKRKFSVAKVCYFYVCIFLHVLYFTKQYFIIALDEVVPTAFRRPSKLSTELQQLYLLN